MKPDDDVHVLFAKRAPSISRSSPTVGEQKKAAAELAVVWPIMLLPWPLTRIRLMLLALKAQLLHFTPLETLVPSSNWSMPARWNRPLECAIL